MSGKKKNLQTPGTAAPPALQIGSRVRCTDDGALGRIAWANAGSVKIKWDDGEQVTWRRDSLAGRPIEFLDQDAAGDKKPRAEPPLATATQEHGAPEQAIPVEPTPTARVAEQATREQIIAAELPAPPAPANTTPPAQATATEVALAEPGPAPQPSEAASPVADHAGGEPAPAVAAGPKRQRKATEPKEKKLSALDAAAKVLQQAGTAMTTREMISAMAVQGYWTSPAGKTPAATLYSAILKEIATKGDASRFAKTGPGRFALRT